MMPEIGRKGYKSRTPLNAAMSGIEKHYKSEQRVYARRNIKKMPVQCVNAPDATKTVYRIMSWCRLRGPLTISKPFLNLRVCGGRRRNTADPA